jgi:hypothetical protein
MAISKQNVDLRTGVRSGAVEEGLERSNHEIQVCGGLLSAATNVIYRTPIDYNRELACKRHMMYHWDFLPCVPSGTAYAVPAQFGVALAPRRFSV